MLYAVALEMSMGRKGKVVVGVVAAVSLIGFMAWRALQPRMRFATMAEVKAVINPRLLAPLPVSKQGQKEKLDALMKEHEGLKAPESNDKVAQRQWAATSFDKNRRLLVKTIELYESGPVQPVRRSIVDADFPNFAVVKQLAKYCAISAEGDAAEGRIDEALGKLKLGYRLTNAYTGNAQTYIEYLVAIAMVAIVDAGTQNLLKSKQLSKAQLQDLLRSLHPIDPDFKALRNSVLGDFQNYTLPMLPKLLTDVDAAAQLEMLGFPGNESSGQMPPGQYDALETAKIASRLAVATLENVGRPYAKIDSSINTYRDSIFEGLPKESFSHLDEGPEKTARELWYRVQMNNTPNSFGRSMFHDLDITQSLLQAACKASTQRSAFRGLVALQLYQRSFGRYPETLDLLVSSGLLAEVPQDFMSGEPLRYSPTKGLIYSVGLDLDDDGGKVTAGKRPFVSEQDDWAYVIP